MPLSPRQLLTQAADRTTVPFRIVYADGADFIHGEGEPAFTLIFRNRRATLRSLLFDHVGLLEAYFAGDLDVEGSLQMAFRERCQVLHRAFRITRSTDIACAHTRCKT